MTRKSLFYYAQIWCRWPMRGRVSQKTLMLWKIYKIEILDEYAVQLAQYTDVFSAQADLLVRDISRPLTPNRRTGTWWASRVTRRYNRRGHRGERDTTHQLAHGEDIISSFSRLGQGPYRAKLLWRTGKSLLPQIWATADNTMWRWNSGHW